MNENKCEIYKKHHNIINGVYQERNPKKWEDIPFIDDVDADDDTGELYNMFLDLIIYDIEDLSGFTNPTDQHNISETIFIIRRNGNYYLCETHGENYIKFSIDISNVDFIKDFNRSKKLYKISDTQRES